MASRYGVSQGTVYRAVTGRTWAHVDEPVSKPKRAQARDVRLSVAKVREARKLRVQGWTYPRLAARYDVHVVTIRRAVVGESWEHVLDPPPVANGRVRRER